MKTEKIVAISLVLGDIYSKAGGGPLNMPPDGAIARFEAVTKGVPCDKTSIVFCTAGHCKKNPNIPQPDRQVSLAGQLARYVCENKPSWSERLIAQALCWSTRNEIRTSIKLAQRLGFASKDEAVTLVIASNLTHLFRIWLYAMLYTPKNWQIKLVWAHHYFSLRSHALEVPKFFRDLWRTFKVLNRLRRFRKLATLR